ncbi:response regulator [Haloarcula sp. H-GB5]
MMHSATQVRTDTDQNSVFIVDDEKDLLLLYEEILEDEYDVRTATSGPEALQKIDCSVDAVLLDRTMPEMSGDEVLGILREEGLNVPIAMVTAVKPTEEVVDLPFDEYMTKPITPNEVLDLVNTLMTRKEYHQASQELFRHVSKKTVLERANCDRSDEYEDLVEEIADLRKNIRSILNDISSTNPS